MLNVIVSTDRSNINIISCVYQPLQHIAARVRSLSKQLRD